MQLYLLGGDQPKSLGYLSIDPSDDSKFLETFDADDGKLWPLRIEDVEQEDSMTTE